MHCSKVGSQKVIWFGPLAFLVFSSSNESYADMRNPTSMQAILLHFRWDCENFILKECMTHNISHTSLYDIDIVFSLGLPYETLPLFVCVGCVWVVEVKFSVMLWSKPLKLNNINQVTGECSLYIGIYTIAIVKFT